MKKQKRRAEPFSLSRALGAAGRTEEVQKLLYGKPALHIDCTGNISIENCREILQYNEDEFLLDMVMSRVAFKGDGILVDTCLLYTSPSPRDGLLSRMPSSA